MILLTEHHLHEAADDALRRYRETVNSSQTVERVFGAGGRFITDFRAACAEIAVAQFTGLRWTGKGSQDHADVAYCLEVRSTQYKAGCLIVRPKDDENRVGVLVIDAIPRFKIAGWLPLKDCKQNHWWHDGEKDPAWWVPQQRLYHPGQLVPWLVAHGRVRVDEPVRT